MLRKHASVMTQQESMVASTIFGATSTTECLIKPVNGQAKLTRNCSKSSLKITDGPRFHLDIQLEDIPLSLSDRQYEAMMHMFDSFSLRFKAHKFQCRRPLVSVAGHTTKWWEFVIETVLHKIRQRNRIRSPEFALRRARQNISYVVAYMRHLTQEVMSHEEEEERKLIEQEQSYEELAVLRRLAVARVAKQRVLVEVSWQGYFSSGYSDHSTNVECFEAHVLDQSNLKITS